MKRMALFVLVLMTIAAPASAAPEDVANDISNSIMSPYCDGVTLHDCPSRAAEELRAEILEWAEAGWSRDRIIAELEDRFGADQISGTPATSGSGLLAWLLPGAVLLAGSAVAFVLARRWTRRPAPTEGPPVSAADRDRIEMELASFRGET